MAKYVNAFSTDTVNAWMKRHLVLQLPEHVKARLDLRFLPIQVVWAKLRPRRQGTDLASARLWGEAKRAS